MDIVSRTIAFSALLVTLLVINLSVTESTSITLEDNGYSGIVVAISEDELLPSDDGTEYIKTLQDLLIETSRALYQATNERAYLKDIDILVPSKWDRTIQGQNPILSYTDSFHQADIRITIPKATSGITLPYTFHSGKCGVAGSHIQIPSDFLSSDEVTVVKAKALVQQWAQFRYGVFEEHGYPGDTLLPYFYRHPQGYDAVTTSNDTIIVGNLRSLEDGMACSVDENGIIYNQEECRFVPDEIGQTATKSIMSFHWIDSIIGFSEPGRHDGRAPHRQNRLCGSKSSWEVILQSPDWINNAPTPGLDTTPNFVVKRNVMKPVILMVLDTSTPTSVNNAITYLHRAMQNFLNTIQPTNENTYVGLYTFEGPDINGDGNYLQELVAPDKLTTDHQNILNAAIISLSYSSFETRNTPAVLRDGISLLAQYKNVGGSIMYISTATASSGSDTLIEPKLAQMLIDNNIKVVIAESGTTGNGGGQTLNRLSTLGQGYYRYAVEWGSYQFFNPLNNYILGLTNEILELNKRTIISKEGSISTMDPWNGFFFIDETLRNDTSVVLVSPLVGLYSVTITDPNEVETELANGDTNWFALDTTIGVASKQFSNPAAGKWSYSVDYDSSNCESCQDVETIQLLVLSSPNDMNAPKLHPWISLTAGTETLDASQHPMIISVRFDSSTYIPVGGLDVSAEIIKGSVEVDIIALTDSGTLVADISKEGIYGGIYYPMSDGEYTINILAAPQQSKQSTDRILQSDQDSYCCGSFLPTSELENFQIVAQGALSVQVINTASAEREPPIVTDLQARTLMKQEGKVYVELTWTTPSNIVEQFVKYSYTEDALSSEIIDSAPEADLDGGSLEPIFGSSVDVYVSVPYVEGENVYLAVQTSSADGNSASHIVWTELNPSDMESSSSFLISSTTPTSTSGSTSTQLSSLTSTGSTETEPSSTITSSTDDSTISSSSDGSTPFTDSTEGSPNTNATEITTTTGSTSTTSMSTTPTTETTTPTTTTSTISSTLNMTSSTENTIATASSISSEGSSDFSFTWTAESFSTDSSSGSEGTSDSSSPWTTESSSIDTGTSTTDTSSSDSESTSDTPEMTTPLPGLTPAEIGIIVGCSVGGVLLVGVFTAVLCCYKSRRNRRSSTQALVPPPTTAPLPPYSVGISANKPSTVSSNTQNTGIKNQLVSSSNKAADAGNYNLGITIEDENALITAL